MVFLSKNVDVNKLRYSEVRTLASGAKTVYVNYGAEKLTIQTPVLYLPYGIGEPYEAKDSVVSSDKDKKYDLTVSFRGMDDNPKVKIFHDKLKEIETKVIDDAFANRLAWFKDDFDGNKTFVSKLFTPIVKVDKDPNTGKPVGKYPPTFKAKLPYDNKSNTFTFDTYDMENNEVDFEKIMKSLKGAKSQLIVQLTGIWFAGGKYGCSWKVVSSKFQLQQITKMTFIQDSDAENIDDENEDDDDIIDGDCQQNIDNGKDLKQEDDVEEEEEEVEEEEEEVEEEEEEVEEEEEPEPEPVKVPVKKVAVKKTTGKTK